MGKQGRPLIWQSGKINVATEKGKGSSSARERREIKKNYTGPPSGVRTGRRRQRICEPPLRRERESHCRGETGSLHQNGLKKPSLHNKDLLGAQHTKGGTNPGTFCRQAVARLEKANLVSS